MELTTIPQEKTEHVKLDFSLIITVLKNHVKHIVTCRNETVLFCSRLR